MKELKKDNKILEVCAFLPEKIKSIILLQPDSQNIEEIRFRTGTNISLRYLGQEKEIKHSLITTDTINDCVNRLTGYSLHSYLETIKQGFITLTGGHRVGICGTTVIKNGEVTGFSHISSLNIRIASEKKGIADAIFPEIINQSTIIISPPGIGKTTFIRDVLRQASDKGFRVSVADERCEICGLHKGSPSFDLGPHTDIIDNCPKATACIMLIKAMSPQIIIIDEITSEKDIEAIKYASYCGVKIFATAHALDLDDFRKRPLYKRLLSLDFFEKAVEISLFNGQRQYLIKDIGAYNV